MNKNFNKIIKIIIIVLWVLIFGYLAIVQTYNKNLPEKEKFPTILELIEVFKTKNWEIETNICQNKPETFINFGNYYFILPGNYTVSYEMKGRGRVYFDSVCFTGQKILYASIKPVDFPQYSLLSFPEDIPKVARDAEFRSKFVDGDEVCIKKIKISRNSINYSTFASIVKEKIINFSIALKNL